MKKKQATPEVKEKSLIRKTYVTEVVGDDEAKKLFAACNKTFDCQVKGNKEVDEARTMVLKISTLDPDRSKDRVFPKGFILDDFLINPVVAAFHDYHKPSVGRALQMGIADNYVVSKMEFPPEGINPEADILHGLYDKGFQHAASIGFIPEEMEPNELGGYDFQKTNLLEYSLVLVPDNPKALRMMYEKGFNPDTYKEDFLEPLEKEAEAAEATEEETTETEPIISPELQARAEAAAKKEANDTPTDVLLGGLTSNQLKNLIADAVKGLIIKETKKVEEPVVKGVQEVLMLSVLLSTFSWVIWCFEQDQDDDADKTSLDKLNQALALILQVVQNEATMSEKSFSLAKLPKGKEATKIVAKAGRAISGKHEEMLKESMDHMSKAVDGVQNVLNAATTDETNDTAADAEKSLAADELDFVMTASLVKAVSAETQEDNEDDIYGMYAMRGGEQN